MTSLEQLRKQRNSLLKESQKLKAKRSEVLEKQRLEAEIKALKNPGSTKAKKAMVSASKKTGSFLWNRAKIVAENLQNYDTETGKVRKRQSPKKRRTTRRR